MHNLILAETMEVKASDILGISPEFLAKSILHRRMQLKTSLPTILKDLQTKKKECQDALDYQTKLQEDAKGNPQEMKKQLKELKDILNEVMSNINQVENFIEGSDVSIKYWEEKIQDGFDELLKDKLRVKEGGDSSYAIRKRKTKEGES